MSKNFLSFVLAVSFLVAANVRADIVPSTFVFGLDQSQQFNGQAGLVWGGPINLGDVSIVATQKDDGSGVSFTLSAANSSINLNGTKNFAVFYTQDAFSSVFSTAGLTSDYSQMNGNGNGWWVNDGYLMGLSPKNPDLPITFDLNYASTSVGWEDFYSILDEFKIGFHFGGEPTSAGVMFSYYVPPGGGGNVGTVPEPATLAILGFGLAGLGAAMSRRKK